MQIHSTILEAINHLAKEQPNKLALCFLEDGKETNLTFHQLQLQSQSFASQLQQKHAAGERAIIMLSSGIEQM